MKKAIVLLCLLLSVFLTACGKKDITDDQAVSAIQKYCYAEIPGLEDYVKAEEYPVYWEVESSDEKEIVVLFRSYTGSLTRYYIDRASGETTVTEFVPGIMTEEEPSEESLNVRDYMD